jgi:hypothetical protein
MVAASVGNLTSADPERLIDLITPRLQARLSAEPGIHRPFGVRINAERTTPR